MAITGLEKPEPPSGLIVRNPSPAAPDRLQVCPLHLNKETVVDRASQREKQIRDPWLDPFELEPVGDRLTPVIAGRNGEEKPKSRISSFVFPTPPDEGRLFRVLGSLAGSVRLLSGGGHSPGGRVPLLGDLEKSLEAHLVPPSTAEGMAESR